MWVNLEGNVRNNDGTLNKEVFGLHKARLAKEYPAYEPRITIPGPTHTAYWLRPINGEEAEAPSQKEETDGPR